MEWRRKRLIAVADPAQAKDMGMCPRTLGLYTETTFLPEMNVNLKVIPQQRIRSNTV